MNLYGNLRIWASPTVKSSWRILTYSSRNPAKNLDGMQTTLLPAYRELLAIILISTQS
jgi:hypothetical protein